ncbi:MAG TPA: hypothetical protein VHT03_12920 [Rhizomicrobium sp.]|jgi:hypothetical protein|nr:hypothetical protein [Rhizomicrobium sp.]
MKTLFGAVAASLTLLALPAIAADSNAPSFENGPVWDMAQIKTKDGHFDDYMHWLATDWKSQEEALKKAGVIVDYKVYMVSNPRNDEPDLILAQEFKNMAAFDTPMAQQYAMQAKIAGSVAKANVQQAARGVIRTIMGDVMLREAVLK